MYEMIPNKLEIKVTQHNFKSQSKGMGKNTLILVLTRDTDAQDKH